MLTPIKIACEVAEALGKTPIVALINCDNRHMEFVVLRQITFYLIRKLTDATLEETGKVYYKNHATVIHGIHQVKMQMEYDKYFAAKVNNIEKFIIHKLKQKYNGTDI
jgi:chromosomal replication initiation ATPase DnaA